VAAEAVPRLMQLVDPPASPAALPAARALATVFSCVDGSYNAAEAAKESIYPLLRLAKCSTPGVAEVAAHALGSLLCNPELAAHAPVDEVVGALTRLLREGSAEGQRDAVLGLACLMQARASEDELAESVGQHGTVLALVALLPGVPQEGPGSEALGAALSCLSVLAKHKGTASFSTSPLHALAEAPYSLGPLVSTVAQGGRGRGRGGCLRAGGGGALAPVQGPAGGAGGPHRRHGRVHGGTGAARDAPRGQPGGACWGYGAAHLRGQGAPPEHGGGPGGRGGL